MANVYLWMSWNVEHFKKTQDNHSQQRIDRIIAPISNEDPDLSDCKSAFIFLISLHGP
jgi:hypothetical protein